jgi:chaperone BCS1
MIPEKRDDIQMYSEYEISFVSSNQEEFEAFIKTCISYYDIHYHGDKEDYEKISIYLTAQDGGYFQYLGKRQKRDMDFIYLPKKQKSDIIEDMEKFLAPTTRARYLKLGINHKRVYLLEGIPGSGKTSLITALASKFNFNIAIVSFIPKMTDVNLLRLLRSLNDTYEDESTTDSKSSKKQTIMIFEDIDCIFKERKSQDENKNNITFSGLLNALDGITSNENLVCFITTNYKSHLDSALLRPGRIDYIMRFDYSTKEQIQDMFRDFTSCQDAAKIQEFYKACADLQIKICTALLQQYLMQYIDQPDEAISNVEKMKKMYDSSKVNKEADETNLYG